MKIHIVKRGETLAKIAKKYQISLEKLLEINSHIKDAEKVTAGTKVKVPTAEIRLKAKEATPVSEQAEAKPVIPKVQPVESYPMETQSIANRTPLPEIPEIPSYGYPPEWSESEYVESGSRQAPPPFPYTGVPGMPPQGTTPMMPEMGYPGMINPGMMPTPFGMPPMMPGMTSPEMMGPGMVPPSSGCQTCGNPPYPYGMSPYGVNPSFGTPYGPQVNVYEPYDKNFFTQPHYPTPYHEQLYMGEADFMPPINPYAAPPVAPMYQQYNPYMPPSGHWPQMWRDQNQDDDSISNK